MTKQEFLDNFYLQYDEISDLAAPGFTPLELSNIASKVQEDLVTTKYNPKSNRLQEGFEETEKRTQDLGELVRYKSFTTFTPGFFDNSVQVVLPNTLVTVGPTDFSDVYWYTIYEDVTSNILDCTIPSNTTKYVKPRVVDTTNGELGVVVRDPHRKPYIQGNTGKVLRLRNEGRKHILITDGSFNITSYNVGYVRKPIPIDLTTGLNNQVSELADSVHRELLEMVISFCLKSTQQLQQFSVEQSIPKE